MRIIMRRDSVIFYIENNRIDNAVKAVSFKLKQIFQFEKSIRARRTDWVTPSSPGSWRPVPT